MSGGITELWRLRFVPQRVERLIRDSMMWRSLSLSAFYEHSLPRHRCCSLVFTPQPEKIIANERKIHRTWQWWIFRNSNEMYTICVPGSVCQLCNTQLPLAVNELEGGKICVTRLLYLPAAACEDVKLHRNVIQLPINAHRRSSDAQLNILTIFLLWKPVQDLCLKRVSTSGGRLHFAAQAQRLPLMSHCQ